MVIMILSYEPSISLHVQTQRARLVAPDMGFHATCSNDMGFHATCSTDMDSRTTCTTDTDSRVT